MHFKNSDRQGGGGVQFSYEIMLVGYSFHTPHFSEPPPPPGRNKPSVPKTKTLRQKCKQEKDKSSRSRAGKRKKWKFFEVMDGTLCDKPQVKPPLVIDSSASTTAELPDTVDDENSENGMFFFFT